MSESKAASDADGVAIHTLDACLTAPARVLAFVKGGADPGDLYEFDRLEGGGLQPTFHVDIGTATNEIGKEDIPGEVLDRLAEDGFSVRT